MPHNDPIDVIQNARADSLPGPVLDQRDVYRIARLRADAAKHDLTARGYEAKAAQERYEAGLLLEAAERTRVELERRELGRRFAACDI